MRHRRLLIFVLTTVTATFFLVYSTVSTEKPITPRKELSTRAPAKPRIKPSVIEKSVYLRYGDTDPIFIFSAYQHLPYIYVVLGSYGYFSRRIFCRYFDKDKKEIGEPFSVTVFPEFIVKCDYVPGTRFIAISVDKRDKIEKSDKKEVTAHEEDFRYSFSACLAPIYGKDPKWLTLVEFFEFYKLQGVDHFYVYRLDSDEFTESILSSYVTDGIADIIPMKNVTGCLRRHRCRHEVQLQDCVYRSRMQSSYVATVDLDERITPSADISLRDYVRSHSSRKIAEFRFRCRWVLRYEEIPNDISKSWKEARKHLPTQLWHNTSHVAPMNHTTKSVIDPLKVESMGVHQGLRFAPETDVFLVPPEDAVVRHYRLQKGWSFFLKEAEEFGEFTNTSLEETLQISLTKNIHSKFCSLWKQLC